MDFNSLMPNEKENPSDLDILNPIHHGHVNHDVYGIKNDDMITYHSIHFDEMIQDKNGNSYAILLDLKTNIGKIVNDGGIKVSYRFRLIDCFYELEKIKSINSQLESAGFDKDDFNDISANIRNYLLNNSNYLTEMIDESDDNDLDVYALDERINPPFDKMIANDFKEMLKEQYDSSIIRYMENVIPDLILDENENIIKSHWHASPL